MDRTTGYRLLEAGTVTHFEIAKTEVHRGTDPGGFPLQIDLNLPAEPETEETDLDCGAFGFLFVIGTLSFAEACPREASIIEYVEDDELRLDDLIDCLHWEGGALKFSADYVRGRLIEADVVLRPDGSAT